jgi:CheY-like chemotaxis protein
MRSAAKEARILIVDDDAANRELLAAFLHGFAYELSEASNGIDAVEQVRTRLPDLVLLDIMMPGMDGFEATRRIKALAKDEFLPIILVTALGESRSRLRGFEAGADEFLQKPIDRSELLLRVGNLLELRFHQRMLAEQNRRLLRLQQFQQHATGLMVHDLKNPLAAVTLNLGFAQSELRQVAGTANAQAAIEDGRRACARLQRQIAELLDIARLEEGYSWLRRSAVEIPALVRDATAEFEREARLAQIDFSVRGGAGRVEADPELLRRAMQAMLDNAFRFTPSGKRIDLEVHDAPGELRFRVACDAPPLAAEARAGVFEKFVIFGDESVPAPVRRGAGLYFCRLVAEAHGGSVTLTDHPEFPTAFGMRLPRLAEPKALLSN